MSDSEFDRESDKCSTEGFNDVQDEALDSAGMQAWAQLERDLYSGNSAFAVGGSLPIRDPPPYQKCLPEFFAQGPITVRWDREIGYGKVILPLAEIQREVDDDDEKELGESPVMLMDDKHDGDGEYFLHLVEIDETPNHTEFNKLLEACTKATFGRNQKHVYDETYRKALKLDASEFCTSFNPYACGLINSISNTLFQVSTDTADRSAFLEAQLYALNIYSGPSGRFKAHIDTPRGAAQFGSLVVCLPVAHKGGALRVSHGGHDMLFDWSQDPSSIHWAAFFSNCEHEVLEVTSGYRVTLTYNLIRRQSTESIARPFPTAHTAITPFTQSLEKFTAIAKEINKSYQIGFYCTHQYYHTVNRDRNQLSKILKGQDALVYMALKDAGYTVTMRPVLRPSEFDMECFHESRYTEEGEKLPDLVGDAFPGARLHYGELRENDRQVFEKAKELKMKKADVWWLNKPTNEDLALAFATYGNEPSVDGAYTAAAVVASMSAAGRPAGDAEQGYEDN